MKDQLEQALQAIRDRGWWDGKDFLSSGNEVCISMALAFVADEKKATGYELRLEVSKYVDLKGSGYQFGTIHILRMRLNRCWKRLSQRNDRCLNVLINIAERSPLKPLALWLW